MADCDYTKNVFYGIKMKSFQESEGKMKYTVIPGHQEENQEKGL